MQDSELLRDYVDHGSQEAFAELVRRYVNLVYSVCQREVGDAQLAEDITQVVFLLLAKKAPSIQPHMVLSGWLFNASRFAARNAVRQERRRQRWESQAMHATMHEIKADDAGWADVEPLLNEAIATLKADDRNVLLLHFFEGHSAADTATRLGISEAAARKRVQRAVERLKRYFLKHGYAVAGAALTAWLTTRAVEAAPAACVELTLNTAGAVTAGGATGTAVGASVSKTLEATVRAMLLAKAQATAAAVSTALVVAGAIHLTMATAAGPPRKSIAIQRTMSHPIAARPAVAAQPIGPKPLTKPHISLPRSGRYEATNQTLPVPPLSHPVSVRLAQTVPAGAGAGGAAPAPALAPTEIRLDGTVASVDAAQRTLVLHATAFTLANGKTQPLAAPKAKTVTITDQTMLHVRGDTTQQLTLTQVLPGMWARVSGADTGTGKALPARLIELWDDEANGVFSLRRPAAPAVTAVASPPAPQAPPTATGPLAANPPPPMPLANGGELDGTFERKDAKGGPLGWRLAPGATIEAENGNHFLRLTNGNIAASILLRSGLKIDPTWKVVRIQTRIRAHNLKLGPATWANAGLGYSQFDRTGNRVGGAPRMMPHLSRDADWIQLAVLADIAPDAAVLNLEPYLLQTTGTVDFDDIEVMGNPVYSTHSITPDFPEGTFEEVDATGLPPAWIPGKRRPLQVLEEKTADGATNHFLRITNDDAASDPFLDGYFKLNPDWAAVRVSIRMRAKNLVVGKNSWETARLGYTFADEYGRQVGPNQGEPTLRQDSDWVTLRTRSPVPKGTQYIKLRCYLNNATGVVDFDDIRVEEDVPAGLAARPLRPGFPEGKFEALDAPGVPQGWHVAANQSVQVIEEQGHHFLRLTNAQPQQTVAVDGRFRLPGNWTAVLIRARLRTKGLKVGPNPLDRARLWYTFEDSQGERVGSNPRPLSLQHDSAWVTLESKALVPADATVIHLMPLLQNATGTFDVDDIEIEPLAAPAGAVGTEPTP